MSQQDCNCTTKSLKNTGLPTCFLVPGVTGSLLLVNMTKSDGSKYKLPLTGGTSIKTLANLVLLIEETVGQDRMYPIKNFKNVADERADAELFSFDDGTQVKIRDGVRNWIGMLPILPPSYLAKLDSCIDLGAYLLDEKNQLIYRHDSTDLDNAYPFPISKETFNNKLINATDSAPAMLQMAFQWREDLRDCEMWSADGLEWTQSDLYGLIDASAKDNVIVNNGANDELTIYIYEECFGGPITGLALADFGDAFNVDDALAVSLISVTESVPGESGIYTLVYLAQTSGELITLPNLSASPYDFANVKTITTATP